MCTNVVKHQGFLKDFGTLNYHIGVSDFACGTSIFSNAVILPYKLLKCDVD